ncbi:hypothetical protein LZD49_21195 [Dyadobacter sp. CY261]|uniref:hypothetical protein n=1 Tax=Dyadobacter sp. CY261 TaxID=2907203 RepID=UPI001F463BD6|nr:hypothetical protein [Dyadobacter sp. CY261]MCF0073010.1 hypothetical protein [Dyadobacter sp. CY261]
MRTTPLEYFASQLCVQFLLNFIEAAFSKECYALMRELKDDINPQNLAYLYDRICFFEGRPQRYGTQYDDSQMYPVEDAKAVGTLGAKNNILFIG